MFKNSKKNLFYSDKLNRTPWSKDPKKRYNQCRHYLNNNHKYGLSITDMLKLQSMRNDAYNEYTRR